MRSRWFSSLILVAACSQTPDGVVLIPSDSAGFFRAQLEELQLVSATKDSLYSDLAATTRLVADINTELATIRSQSRDLNAVTSPESPLSASDERAKVLERVKELTNRVRQSESSLRVTRQRLASLNQVSDEMRAQLAVFETTVADLNQMVEGQKATIAGLEAELGALRATNLQLAAEKSALVDTVVNLTERDNTVYYVVGSRKSLKEQGIIEETGGGRWLLVTRTGETLVPAANLTPSHFTKIDKRLVTDIPLPNAEKTYEIVSTQNLDYIEPDSRQGNRRIKGHLRINSPEQFWAPSKFLILVER